jgi:uncharacterized protein
MNQIVFAGSERSESSMGVQENVQTVKDVYQAFSRGDVPGFLALMAEDVEWHVPGTYAISGTYQGHEGLVRWLQRVAQDFDIQDLQVREFVAQGDRVLVIGWERGRVKPTNRNYEAHWVMAFALRNRKVAEFREYTDTEAAASAYGATAGAAA